MEKQGFIFTRKNYMLMFGGIALIILGYVLMAGGGSTDPEVFNPEIFSARRIIVAPIIILAGLLIEVYAIMTTGNSQNNG